MDFAAQYLTGTSPGRFADANAGGSVCLGAGLARYALAMRSLTHSRARLQPVHAGRGT